MRGKDTEAREGMLEKVYVRLSFRCNWQRLIPLRFSRDFHYHFTVQARQVVVQ